MRTPWLEALNSDTDAELRPTRLDIAAVDTGLHSVIEEMAAHPRAVDHDFMLDRIAPPMLKILNQ